MRTARAILAAAAYLGFFCSCSTWALEPGDFRAPAQQFDSDSGLDVIRPNVAGSATGDVVVGWAEYPRQDSGDSPAGFVRFFRADGNPRGEQQRLYYGAPDTLYSETDVGIDDSGVSTATWISTYIGGGQHVPTLRYQRFTRDGAALSPPDSIDLRDAAVSPPHLAVSAGGDAIIVWRQTSFSSNIPEIRAFRLDKNGNVAGAPFTIVTLPAGSAYPLPAVAMDATGNAVVVWRTGSNIYARRIRVDGTTSSIAQVNTTEADARGTPDVGVDREGGFTVTWIGTSGESVMRRRYGPGGGALETEVEIFAGLSLSPSIGTDADGDTVIAWGADSFTRLVAQTFDAQGLATAPAVVVAESDREVVERPRVAVDGDGDAVFAWQFTLLGDNGSGVRNGFIRRSVGPESVDLAVSVSDGQAEAAAASGSTYTVSVRNTHAVASPGVGQADGVVLQLAAPAEPQALSGTATDSWECAGTQTLECTLAEPLAAGAEARLTLVLTRPDDDCQQAQTTASIAAAQFDAGTANNAAVDTTLVGKPGTIEFDSSALSAREDVSPLQIGVRRSGGCLGDISVAYATEDVSTESGFDFVGGESFTFPSGETQLRLPIDIVDDADGEATETFDVVLTSASNGASVGEQSRTTVSIMDDDGSGGGAFSLHLLLFLVGVALVRLDVRTCGWLRPGYTPHPR
ncbi:MAG: Calx-beta domain-containing protein [Sinimarinibacterium sp.]|jgi:hypothetical protein